MKRFLAFAIFLVSFSAFAFAAAKNTQSVNLPENVTVGSAQLPAGDYKLSWTGTGSTVQVTLEQKGVKKPITTTVPAKLVDQKRPVNSLVIDHKDGANKLQVLQFTKFSLLFADTPAQGQ